MVIGWVTVFPQRIGNTSGAICLGKQRVKRNNDGDLFKSIFVTKRRSTRYLGDGGSVEKQLINGSGAFTNEADLDWPMDCMWRIGFLTGPVPGG